ncbi:RNA polymerase sigma-70 factor (ECF subfamily) [Actinocorallia herbida]|uniref:RNA polymerase sigma-70 factor (ECF subfamily) n=1 Tax=Actinocorallia herbida TaxID=58109 RepID=A0A3N1D5I8_9ACTN|nr:RNA polymerase sigma factor [Actinocorallia herbida]ROO88794.1 RNA polymerase sigma-70 factor (ECF subfamily) [Actinocorallia herbida]
MEPEDPDLAESVRRAQEGDVAAFDALYVDVQPRMLRYLRTLVGDDAEDAAAEAWLQIARDLRRFSGDSAGFRGWTARIARNRAMDLLRQRQRRPAEPVPLERLVDLVSAESTESLVLDSLATEAALGLVGSLPPDQAEAVMLRVVFGLDAPAAGRVLGKRPGAVRTAAHRGLRNLAKRLGALPTRSASGPTTPRPENPENSGKPVTAVLSVALEDLK